MNLCCSPSAAWVGYVIIVVMLIAQYSARNTHWWSTTGGLYIAGNRSIMASPAWLYHHGPGRVVRQRRPTCRGRAPDDALHQTRRRCTRGGSTPRGVYSTSQINALMLAVPRDHVLRRGHSQLHQALRTIQRVCETKLILRIDWL